MIWRLYHRTETVSTNLDARTGIAGDVFTADFQTSGRGRLDHRWLSPPGTNLMMSVVLPANGRSPSEISTVPLVVGYALLQGLINCLRPTVALSLKWPNDIHIAGRKIAGILCERSGENVIAGIGINVNQTTFAPEIADRATSLARLETRPDFPRAPDARLIAVRTAVLNELTAALDLWQEKGFAALLPRLAAYDELRGRRVSVYQTDSDCEPIVGISGGINPDGSLDVGGKPVYAGEAHVATIGEAQP